MNNTLITKELINQRLKEKQIELLSEYINTTVIGTFRCLKCNHQWDKKLHTILYKHKGCPYCNLINIHEDTNLYHINKKRVVSKKLTIDEILNKLKLLNIELKEEYKGIMYKGGEYKYSCTCMKHPNIEPFKIRLKNVFKGLKLNKDYTPCKECRIENRIKFIKEKCPNLEILEFHRQRTATSNFYRIKWKCKHCNHIFNRTDDEVLRGAYFTCNDCPKCGYDRHKRLYNKVFDSFETYRAQINNDTKWVNRKYTKLVNSTEFHIDHKCSAYDCYVHCIPVWMCSSPVNLCLLKGKDNLIKNKKSSMTVDELIMEFSKWIVNNPEYLKYVHKELKLEVDVPVALPATLEVAL